MGVRLGRLGFRTFFIAIVLVLRPNVIGRVAVAGHLVIDMGFVDGYNKAVDGV